MKNSQLNLTILVVALGYAVDVFDIVLFSAVRVPSLSSLGLSGEPLTSTGVWLLNLQLVGMLIGGIVWGIIGDKVGRTSVLFGSIFVYSAANIVNAFVADVNSYAALRFIAGFGLAGELGVGITLVSEMMDRQTRGYGAMLVAASGVLGGISAGLMSQWLPWRATYVFGGVLGLVLLILRWRVMDSALFLSLKKTGVARGRALDLLLNRSLFMRYFACILLGAPIWILIGIFMTLSPEIARSLSVKGAIAAGLSILYFNIGFGIGDLSSATLSQLLRSRKRATAAFLAMTVLFVLVFLNLREQDPSVFYFLCVCLGLGAGYWSVFLLLSAEQFGTNLRATTSTSLPNLVRVLVVPAVSLLQWMKPTIGLIASLHWIALVLLALSFVALFLLKESYGTDLDFVEGALGRE